MARAILPAENFGLSFAAPSVFSKWFNLSGCVKPPIPQPGLGYSHSGFGGIGTGVAITIPKRTQELMFSYLCHSSYRTQEALVKHPKYLVAGNDTYTLALIWLFQYQVYDSEIS